MALDTNDVKLAEKLRTEDPEQFQTLVRMHLSFVLDLNTDDYDCTADKSKFRQSKWPFSKKTKCLSKGVMEGAPLTQEGICQVYQLIEYLNKEQNICQEGIFRRSGKMTRQQELKTLLNQGVALNLDNSHFSVHDCASVLKNFLAELPEPLLTDAHYPAYCQIAELCDAVTSAPGQPVSSSETRLLRALQLLLLLLPMENRVLLRDVLQLLHVTASYESSNKMSADSLSTLFTPHLLCPRKLTPEAFHVNSQTMSGVVAFMIRQGVELYNIPPKLATDIRAYWVERERRKRTLKELNESLCDSTAANTVFSFVDRERTAQANNSNPTEAALAQLYAHIQSLPESSKKRKLIKQFNKENGQGTPLQCSYNQKQHLRSKSLGDSIKKHIFNKGLKRQKNSNNSGHFGALRSLSQEMLSETMMTPRSRKPVIVLSGSNLCHLANMSAWRKADAMKQQGPSNTGEDVTQHHMECSLLNTGSQNEGAQSLEAHNAVDEAKCNEQNLLLKSKESEQPNIDCGSGDSLTSTFKSYLFSRSVLSASPVDLSFSSRTGDFDESLCSESRVLGNEALSESLLYCLDGNDPSTSSVSGGGDKCSNCSSSDCPSKQHMVEIDESVTPMHGERISRQHNEELEVASSEGLTVSKANEALRESCFVNEYRSATSVISDTNYFRKGVIHETSL